MLSVKEMFKRYDKVRRKVYENGGSEADVIKEFRAKGAKRSLREVPKPGFFARLCAPKIDWRNYQR